MVDKNKQNPKLLHLAEFESVLENYRPSQESIELFRSVPLVMLVGPTAAGRNTLINLLTATGRYKMVVSTTTRQKRFNNGVLEENGREYWFASEEEVLEGLKRGEFIEAAIIHGQQVSGAHIDEFKQVHDSGLIALKEIEPHGAELYQSFNPNILSVFLLPPNFDTWMERLRGRGDMDDEELIRRLKSAEEEIMIALRADFYQFVINNEIHEAAVAVDELANGRAPDEAKQRLGRNHAEQLVIDVRLYLENK